MASLLKSPTNTERRGIQFGRAHAYINQIEIMPNFYFNWLDPGNAEEKEVYQKNIGTLSNVK